MGIHNRSELNGVYDRLLLQLLYLFCYKIKLAFPKLISEDFHTPKKANVCIYV